MVPRNSKNSEVYRFLGVPYVLLDMVPRNSKTIERCFLSQLTVQRQCPISKRSINRVFAKNLVETDLCWVSCGLVPPYKSPQPAKLQGLPKVVAKCGQKATINLVTLGLG